MSTPHKCEWHETDHGIFCRECGAEYASSKGAPEAATEPVAHCAKAQEQKPVTMDEIEGAIRSHRAGLYGDEYTNSLKRLLALISRAIAEAKEAGKREAVERIHNSSNECRELLNDDCDPLFATLALCDTIDDIFQEVSPDA
jgi:hypothetical protein